MVMIIEVLKKDIGDDPAKAAMRQTFIQHYYDKYGDLPFPANWQRRSLWNPGSRG